MTSMAMRAVAAVDIGAESGRVMLARYDGHGLQLEEIYRFANRPAKVQGHLFWDVLALWNEICLGLRKAREQAGHLDSIGVDTWGVDYALVDDSGLLVSQPYHYRDHRTEGMLEHVASLVPRGDLYHRTGIQFLPINTLYQLAAHQRQQPSLLTDAYRLLLMPDLFHYWLTGEMVSEYTNATTTQMWDAAAHRWAGDLLATLGIPSSLLPPVVEAGTPLGLVVPDAALDLGRVPVVAPATHDTGSAVAATPVATNENGWGYISSGTWSLVGQELDHPLLTDAAMASNFTNEGGVFGTIRFLKNVMGLWLVQGCLREWQRDDPTLDYERLILLAEQAPAFAASIDPDDRSFLAPDNMLVAIGAYRQAHGLSTLSEPGAIVRCILESLVLRYRQVFEECTRLTGRAIHAIHILGGGAQNALVNQWLSDAMNVPVLAGPIEATALGNALLQLVGLRELATLADIRAVALQQHPAQIFTPRAAEHSHWQEHYARFQTR
jgi:rhamnulokinase